MRRARTVTLFSGGGILEAGLRGYIDPVLAIEFDPRIASQYASVYGDHVVCADIGDVDFREAARKVGDIDYLHASPVCKQFSIAKSMFTAGERESDRKMGRKVAEALKVWLPPVFTLENVEKYVQSDAFSLVTSALDRAGYSYDAHVYEASQYGTPSRRKRLLVRAVLGGRLPPIPPPQGPQDWFLTIRDMIPYLPDSDIPEWIVERCRRKGVDVFDVQVPYLVAGGSADSAAVPLVPPGNPGITIKATPKEKHRVLLPGGRVKALTPEAMARLLGIPDWYKLPANRILAVTVMGNGVPPPLAREVIGPLLASQMR